MISVVIPTWNEAERLPDALEALRQNGAAHEVIVVDAGSQDATVTLARQASAQVLFSPRRQRAAQLNLGAQAAQGETILWLHADTRLPPDALDHLARALDDPRVVGGAFARRFDLASPLLRFSCALADWRGRLFGWFLGDQAIFARRRAFVALGGFADLDLFEDLDFARRLKRHGRVLLLRPTIVSSGRRFARRGPWRTIVADAWLTCRYLAGALPRIPAPSAAREKKARPARPDGVVIR